MSNKIKMQNVRLSFPSLFQHGSFGGESTGKYEATFMLDKDEHAGTIATIEKVARALAKEKLKGKLPKEDNRCYKDGDSEEMDDRPECDGKVTIKASGKKRPLTLDRDKSPVTEDDSVFYAGCYVNAIVTLWAQNNSWGKRINAQLDGVQFVGHGEPFGDGGIDVDEFDAFGDDDDDDDDDDI